jgi:hypothetical protein
MCTAWFGGKRAPHKSPRPWPSTGLLAQMFKALHLDNVRRLFCPISTSPSQITIMSIRVGFVMCRELRMIIFYQCLTPVPSMTEKETPPKESHADRTARRSPASSRAEIFVRYSSRHTVTPSLRRPSLAETSIGATVWSVYGFLWTV